MFEASPIIHNFLIHSNHATARYDNNETAISDMCFRSSVLGLIKENDVHFLNLDVIEKFTCCPTILEGNFVR